MRGIRDVPGCIMCFRCSVVTPPLPDKTVVTYSCVHSKTKSYAGKKLLGADGWVWDSTATIRSSVEKVVFDVASTMYVYLLRANRALPEIRCTKSVDVGFR